MKESKNAMTSSTYNASANTNPNQPRLTLYHLSYCPFCHKVRRAADELGVSLNLVEIQEHPEARALLMRELGRATVPVLRIEHADGGYTLLPESSDIVRYLRRNVARLRSAA